MLVVDDYQDAREMYSHYLNASGFRTAEARSGTEAVAKARELKPHCILMDLSLPGIDGWEATRQLKADHVDHEHPGRRDHRPCVRAGFARRARRRLRRVRPEAGAGRHAGRRGAESGRGRASVSAARARAGAGYVSNMYDMPSGHQKTSITSALVSEYGFLVQLRNRCGTVESM